MHKFYVFHSFTLFHVTEVATACLYLASKVEEQPRIAKDIIRTAYRCLHPEQPQLNTIPDVSEF
jgi:cyclin T